MLQQLRSLQRSGNAKALDDYISSHPELDFAEGSELHAVLAVVRFLRNEQDQARHHFQQINPDDLNDPESLADYGLGCLLTGQGERALVCLERAAAMPGPSATVFQRLGAVLLAANRLEEAEKAYRQSLDLEPGRSEILSNLGGIMLRQGDLNRALDYYTRALQKKPDLEIARNQRARVLVAMQRVDELLEEKEEQLSEKPDDPVAHLELAAVLVQAGHNAEAQAVLDAALDRFPDNRLIRVAFVRFCFQQKMWWQVGEKLLEWSRSEPEDMELRLLLNQARLEAGFTDTLREDLEEIADTAAGLPMHGLLKARLLIAEARADEALELLTESADKFPGSVDIKYQLYEVLSSLGRLDQAEAVVREAGLLDPGGIARRIESRGHEANDLELDALRRVAQNPVMPGPQRSGAMFTLAKVLEKREDHAASFEAVIQANELARPSLNYDWKKHRGQIESLVQSFTPDVVNRLGGLGHESMRPVFVTGMPRSGTTLTEQILCSHPQVYGAGELQWITRLTRLVPRVIKDHHYPEAISVFRPEHLLSAADYYLERVSRQNSTARLVVDKMPHNFDHIGLIALIFPRAVIIHMKRDPRDVAVSNYYQNYAAAHGLMGFAYSLEDIGHMLNDYDRIMKHWHGLFPGRIFELDYQQMVHEPEPVIRTLLEHCGLDWDDRVLRFHETRRPVRTASIRQIRQGIYTGSIQKWRKYRDYLDPLEQVLVQGFKPLAETGDPAAPFVAGPTR